MKATLELDEEELQLFLDYKKKAEIRDKRSMFLERKVDELCEAATEALDEMDGVIELHDQKAAKRLIDLIDEIYG